MALAAGHNQTYRVIRNFGVCDSMSMMAVITHLGLNGSLSYSVSIIMLTKGGVHAPTCEQGDVAAGQS